MFGAVSEKDHILRVKLRKGTRFARLFLAGLEAPPFHRMPLRGFAAVLRSRTERRLAVVTQRR